MRTKKEIYDQINLNIQWGDYDSLLAPILEVLVDIREILQQKQ